ncbi:hypothetical protein [Methylobacterium brachiatum]|jgi:hypothetical protein|uniref:hypothetical protein n=1 Tax=Methylobacterium brachiatum TaxID=269660 RepID=UPI002448C577|nr:hypothetical protein [Methylobacterium brachiatum]MDH2310801.1 hypothetical protein [Methylobacterium brachiatum]
MREDLQAVRRRVLGLWTSRTVCGLLAVACGLRLNRIIRLRDAGRLGEDEALRLALETECVARMFRPLPSDEAPRLISL